MSSPEPVPTAAAPIHKINFSDATRRPMPTPDGAIPMPKRRRRGMISLQDWDRQVAQHNAANGLSSESTAPSLLQTIADTRQRSYRERNSELAIDAVEPTDGKPRDPGGETDEVVDPDDPAGATNRGALAEPAQQTDHHQADPDQLQNARQPDPEAIENMKDELADHGESFVESDATEGVDGEEKPAKEPTEEAKPAAKKTAKTVARKKPKNQTE